MKNKRIAVVFTTNNARIMVNPEKLGALKGRFNVMIDPDLSHVGGVDPHYWKVVRGEIRPMNNWEAELRRLHVEKFGADNDVDHALELTPLQRVLYSPQAWVYAVCTVVLVGLAVAAWRWGWFG